MPDTTPDIPESDKARVELYRRLVLEYEQLDETIDNLLTRNKGGTKDMSEADYQHYRELAERRDAVHNQIRVIESMLLPDDGGENEDA